MWIGKRHLLLAVVGVPLAGLLVAWLGFFNVGASSGHWKITDWFLHFAMRSAVRTYALAEPEPPAFDDAMLPPAAGHFARGCAPCHGAPGEPRSPAVLRMLPQPPDLARVVDGWTDRQLFRIVKHGVRFTGMPAWPSQSRDDEVWWMVAFLRRLPEMDADAYRRLAGREDMADRPDDALGDTLAGCGECHGQDGGGRSPLMPVIAGQKEAYLLESLRAYAHGERASGIMGVAAVEARPELWPAVARAFAQQPWPASTETADTETAEAGRAIAERGVPARSVPACLSCHGEAVANPHHPRLDAQRPGYLATQLHLFRAGERGDSAYGRVMTRVARGLEPDEIEALARYFASRGRHEGMPPG